MANRVTCGLSILLVVISFCYGLKFQSDCDQPLDKGPCRSHYESYYFDMKSHECKPFIWSGCGGNGNRFYSLEECHFACSYYMKPYLRN